MSDLYAYSSDSSSDTSDGESTTTMPTSIIKDNGGMLPVPFRRTIKAGVLYRASPLFFDKMPVLSATQNS